MTWPGCTENSTESKQGKNYYIIDACFLANRFIPAKIAPDEKEKTRIKSCMEWWGEIEAQLTAGTARGYVPDICIAEAFKTLAEKHYENKWFKKSTDLNSARDNLEKFVKISTKTLKSANRNIKVPNGFLRHSQEITAHHSP